MAVIFGSTGLTDITDALDVISQKAATSAKPIYTVLPSVVTAKKDADYFHGLGNVSFSDEVLLARALSAVVNTPGPEECIELPRIDVKGARAVVEGCADGYLPPEKVQALLDAAGIDRAREAVVTRREEAVRKAKVLGFPLVMKVVGPIHKSDVGGVVLDVRDVETVESEFERMMQIEETTAVLIQPMLSGMELFAGASYEEDFGHMILCGLGGVFIEVLNDTSAELSPVSGSRASEMIRSLRSYKLIQGARGKEGVDEAKFAETISRLSALCEIAPEIKELDLNPLLGTRERVVAVDARIRIEKGKGEGISIGAGKALRRPAEGIYRDIAVLIPS
jgi:acetyltransferase